MISNMTCGLQADMQCNVCAQLYPICRAAAVLCNAAPKVPYLCPLALKYCHVTQYDGTLAFAGNVNVYDVRKPCIGELCYDFSPLENYLAQPSVRQELGVGDRECVPFRISVGLYDDCLDIQTKRCHLTAGGAHLQVNGMSTCRCEHQHMAASLRRLNAAEPQALSCSDLPRKL